MRTLTLAGVTTDYSLVPLDLIRQRDLRAVCFTNQFILPRSHVPDTALLHQVLQADPVEKAVDLLTEVIPQFMCQTLMSVMAIIGSAATCGINGFIHGRHDLGNRNPACGTTQ